MKQRASAESRMDCLLPANCLIVLVSSGSGTIRDGEQERGLCAYGDEECAHGTEGRYGQAVQIWQVASVSVWSSSLV